jgi:hypothetical protein
MVFSRGATFLLLPLNNTDKKSKLKKMIQKNIAPADIADQL